jgi:hypothetical protein
MSRQTAVVAKRVGSIVTNLSLDVHRYVPVFNASPVDRSICTTSEGQGVAQISRPSKRVPCHKYRQKHGLSDRPNEAKIFGSIGERQGQGETDCEGKAGHRRRLPEVSDNTPVIPRGSVAGKSAVSSPALGKIARVPDVCARLTACQHPPGESLRLRSSAIRSHRSKCTAQAPAHFGHAHARFNTSRTNKAIRQTKIIMTNSPSTVQLDDFLPMLPQQTGDIRQLIQNTHRLRVLAGVQDSRGVSKRHGRKKEAREKVPYAR